jgi:hypothetical protein
MLLCTKKSETWCVSFLCAAAKVKNIKKYLKKKKNRKKKQQRLEQKSGKKRKREKKEYHISRNVSVLCTTVIILPQAYFLAAPTYLYLLSCALVQLFYYIF